MQVSAENDAPVASSLATQDDVVEDTPSIYRFDAFKDEEDDAARVPLKYSYTVERVERVGDADIKTDVSPLWIDFDDKPLDDQGNVNPNFLTFTFTPSDSSHAGKYEVTVVGADAGIPGKPTPKSVSAKFVLTVSEFNDVPVASALQDHLLADALVEDDPKSFYVFDAFTDEETSPLTYTFEVVRVGAEDTPVDVKDWMGLGVNPGDPSKQRFSFTPSKSWHAGSYKVTVVGEDKGIGGDDATKERTRKSISVEFLLDVVAVNDRPDAPAEFSEQVSKRVEEGGAETYQVPVFTDEEDDAAKESIEYEAKLVVVDRNGDESLLDIPYDNWIAFDKNTRTFRFTPSESRHKGVYTVRVFARDTDGDETSVQFRLTVGEFNDAPVASTLADKTVVEDTPSTYKFDAFTDEETSTLTYSYTVERVVSGVKTAVSGPEIEWIEFDDNPLDDLGNVNPTFRTFTFTPSDSSHAGKYEVTVKGEDAGIPGEDSSKKSVSEKFALTVLEFNDEPEASALKDHRLTDAVVEDTKIIYKFDAFKDEETSPLTYSYKVVRIEDDDSKTEVSGPEIEWIEFDDDPLDDLGNLNPTFRTFTFTPHRSWHAGKYEVTVKGEDAGIGGDPDTKKSAIAEFMLTVGEFNDAPVASSPKDHRLADAVVEDTPSIYVFDAFTDEEEDKASRSLSYTSFWAARDSAGRDIVDVDGEKTFVPHATWIEFGAVDGDATKLQFRFKPDRSWDAGKYTLRVVGTDEGIPDEPAAKSAIAEFVLEVLDFNDAPVASTLVDQKVAEDTTASYRFDAFTDEEEDKVSRSLLYTAFWAEKDSAGNDKVDADGKQTFVSLPRWIVFDGLKRRFTFEPDKSWHAGKHTLRVVGTEKGISGKPTPKSAFAEFVLNVVEVNDAPVASTPTEQKVVEDTTATYRFDVFTDEEDDAAGVPLKYRAFWASKDGDGEDVVSGAGEKVFVPLPAWIPFDRETRTFTFRPKEDSHAGVHTLRVVGEDAGIGTDAATKKRSHADFVLRVESVNDAPVASTLEGPEGCGGCWLDLCV